MTSRNHRANRTAITLLEVLIAIGILSVGLASVFALIPAARHLSGKALTYDRSATLAENAINEFLTRGFHNPRTWVPSPLAPLGPPSRRDWPFEVPASRWLTGGWPAVSGQTSLLVPSSQPNVLIFDPLDRSEVRDPTQPPSGFPPLGFQPQWVGTSLTHPVIALSGSPHDAPFDPSSHLPGSPSHPFEYAPLIATGSPYGSRLVDELFRLQDDVAYSLDGLGPDDFPENIFASGSIGQRQFSGRYSCLFMLQRIGNDWQPGQAAHLTVIVFRDRDPSRSPVMLTADPLDIAGNPNPTWRIGHSGSTHPYPMPNALVDFRVKDVLKPGTLVYDAGTLSWWKAMYAANIDPVTLLPNNDNVTSLATAVASADLVYNQNQCVWTAMGPNATATAPTAGPLFAFPDAVAVSHRQIVLASDDRWSE